MYNGIGILTTRGTGTSGHVQGNRFNLRGPPRQNHSLPDDDANRGPSHKKPNKDILEHNRKREIELQVETLRAQLEDDEVPEDEIEAKLTIYRQELIERAEAQNTLAAAAATQNDKLTQETHQLAQRKVEQMDKLRSAFGFKEGEIREGDAFNHEIQEQKRQQRLAEREAKEQARKDRIRKAEKEAEKREKKYKKEEKKRARKEKEERKRADKERKRRDREARDAAADREEEKDVRRDDIDDDDANKEPAAATAREEEQQLEASPPRRGCRRSVSPPRRKRRSPSHSRSRSPPRKRSSRRRSPSRSTDSRSSSGHSSGSSSSSDSERSR